MEQKDPFDPRKSHFRNPDFQRMFERMVSDYAQAASVFEKQNIRNTIVFFGSSQIASIEKVQERIGKLANDFKKGNELFKDRFNELSRQSDSVFMTRYYHAAEELAYRLAKWTKRFKKPQNKFYVCSGGGPGIMEAANRGAQRAGCPSLGLKIDIEVEQPGNEYLEPGFDLFFHEFPFRKYWFFYFARAIVVFPGGLGTLDEIFEILNLIRSRKITRNLPIILFGEDYWKSVINFEPLIRYGTIGSEDVSFIHYTDDVEEACKYLVPLLEKHYIEEE